MAKMTVEDSSLTAVADAIRSKTGNTEGLVFPEGFINGISGLHKEDPYYYFKALAGGTIETINEDMLSGLTSLKDHAFRGCTKLKSISFPDGITSFRTYVFSECYALVFIKCPNTLESIGVNAFRTCNSLVEIELPASLTSMDNTVFNSCTRLTKVVMKSQTPPSIGTSVFPKILKTIMVPKGTLEAYQSATNWSEYADLMVEATE